MILLPTVPPAVVNPAVGFVSQAIAEAEGELRLRRLVEIAAHVEAVVSVP